MIQEQELLHSVLSLLPAVMQAIGVVRATNEEHLLSVVTTCLLSMLFQGEPNAILTAGGSLQPDSSEQQAYLSHFCELVFTLIRDCPFAKNWFAVVMLFYSVLAKALSILASHLIAQNPSYALRATTLVGRVLAHQSDSVRLVVIV
jgi:hypothetical protein